VISDYSVNLYNFIYFDIFGYYPKNRFSIM
jgi:hypothetical protein